jgi:hypothetical protein
MIWHAPIALQVPLPIPFGQTQVWSDAGKKH